MKTIGLVIAATLLASSAQAALTISTAATSNVSCSAGVCSATAADAVLNVSDVTTMLAAGSLTIQSGSQAQDILVEAPFSWTSSNSLTLDSFRAITVDKPVSDAGPSALNIVYNNGGTGGELLFRYKGRVSFTSTKNALAINGQSFKLVKNIASLASKIAANPSGFYALADNYNAAKDGTYSTAPIAVYFGGTFEGLGNTISNLSIDCESSKFHRSVALFPGIYPSTGAVKSLRLDNISYIVHAKKSGGTGGLTALNAGYVFDDHISGTITANVGAGGLAAGNGGSIANSSADVVIKAGGRFLESAGLVGENGGTISRSYATGLITAGTGGLVGRNAGGLIVQSYATGKLKGKNITGGLVGANQDDGSDGTISQSYATGKIVAAKLGGLAGGFIGTYDSGTMSNNYWDVQTSRTNQGTDDGNIAGVTGLTTKQFKSRLPTGFDPSVWAQTSKINNGYPYLISNPPAK